MLVPVFVFCAHCNVSDPAVAPTVSVPVIHDSCGAPVPAAAIVLEPDVAELYEPKSASPVTVAAVTIRMPPHTHVAPVGNANANLMSLVVSAVKNAAHWKGYVVDASTGADSSESACGVVVELRFCALVLTRRMIVLNWSAVGSSPAATSVTAPPSRA